MGFFPTANKLHLDHSCRYTTQANLVGITELVDNRSATGRKYSVDGNNYVRTIMAVLFSRLFSQGANLFAQNKIRLTIHLNACIPFRSQYPHSLLFSILQTAFDKSKQLALKVVNDQLEKLFNVRSPEKECRDANLENTVYLYDKLICASLIKENSTTEATHITLVISEVIVTCYYAGFHYVN